MRTALLGVALLVPFLAPNCFAGFGALNKIETAPGLTHPLVVEQAPAMGNQLEAALKAQMEAKSTYIQALEAENSILRKQSDDLEAQYSQLNPQHRSDETNEPSGSTSNVYTNVPPGAIAEQAWTPTAQPDDADGETIKVLRAQVAARNQLIAALEEENKGLRERISELKRKINPTNP